MARAKGERERGSFDEAMGGGGERMRGALAQNQGEYAVEGMCGDFISSTLVNNTADLSYNCDTERKNASAGRCVIHGSRSRDK